MRKISLKNMASCADPYLTSQVCQLKGCTEPPSFTVQLFALNVQTNRFQRLSAGVAYDATKPEAVKAINAVNTKHIVVRGNYSSLSLCV